MVGLFNDLFYMRKLYAITFVALLLFTAGTANAQNPTILINSSNFSWSTCLNTKYTLPIITSGTFNADNKFIVQIRKGEFSSILKEVPATLNSNTLELSVTDSLTFANSGVQMRVVSSSPRVQSEWSAQLFVHSKGRVILNPLAVTDTLNAYDDARIAFSGFSSTEVRVTMADSTRFSFYPSPYEFSTVQSMLVKQSGNFNIAHAENVCGAMQVSGSYRAVVNATSVKVIAATPVAVCENGEIRISFSASENVFTPQTKYKLRFLEDVYGTSSAEVAARIEGNTLIAKFPTQYRVDGYRQFFVRIVTENPATVSSWSEQSFMVAAAPSAVFNSSSQIIGIGENASLDIVATGLPPFTAELVNGMKVSSFSSSLNFLVNPASDESYTLKSVSSGCGTITFDKPQTVVIKVRPGIRIEEMPTPQIICAGKRARIKIATNVQLTDATTYQVKLRDSSNGAVSTFNASRSGDYIEFDLPSKPGGYIGGTYQVVTTNPTMQSQESYNILAQSVPNITFAGYNNTFTYEMPSQVRLNYVLLGGGPHKLEYTDGTVEDGPTSNYLSEEFFLRESMDFKIKSISNSCYRNDNPPGVRLTVTNAANPGIYLEPVKPTVCSTDSIEVVFGAVGQFGAGNQFIVQGYNNCCTFQNFLTVDKAGKYKVKIPVQYYAQNNGAIRVSSTNPVLLTEVQIISIQTTPGEFYLYPQSKEYDPYRFMNTDGTREFSLQSNAGPLTEVTYTLNGVEHTYTNPNANSSYIPMISENGQTSVYEFKSAKNACGSTPVNMLGYVIKMPYRIQLSNMYNTRACAGGPIAVPFGIVDGTAADNATYSLQLNKLNSSDLLTLVSGVKDRILRADLPADMSVGHYRVRVISSDGAISDYYDIQVGVPPTVIVQPENGGSEQTIEAGQNIVARLIFTGSSPWTTIWDDNTVIRNTYSSPENVYFQPTTSKTYTIKSVSNSCGFGTASGSIKVNVRPRLTVTSDSWSVCEGGSSKITYSLDGDADLADDYIRFELVDLSTRTSLLLDSTKVPAGQLVLKLPQTLTGSQYQIVATVKKYALQSIINMSITTKPNLTLSGNSVVNSGEGTYIILKTNKYTSDSPKYVLSDGTTGNIYSGQGQVNYIEVRPKQTTTYTITSVSNACGEGIKSGSAVVEVNPPSERNISILLVNSLSSSGICTGDTIAVEYRATGTFTAGNKFTVQISDTLGLTYRQIATLNNTSPLKAVLPTDLFSNRQYRIKVIASDAGTASSAYSYALTAGQKAKARFASESVIFDGKTNPVITVLLEGGAPWTYQYGTDFTSFTRHTSNATDVFELFQASPNQYYRLFRVANSCGSGTIENPSTVRVEVITATEPDPVFKVTVAPNPAQELLTLTFENTASKNLSLYDLQGRLIMQMSSRKLKEEIPISTLTPGVYMIMVESKGRKNVFKVIKQ